MFAVLLLWVVSHAQTPLAPLKPGMRAPVFSLPDSNGRKFDSAQSAGRPLFLLFFTGGGQRPLLTFLADLDEKNRGKQLQIAAVHFTPGAVKPEDRLSQLAGSLPREEPRFPILLNGGSVAQAYGVEKTNALFYIDGGGVIRGSVALPQSARAEVLAQKLALWSGEAPPKLGWRNDLLIIWEYAVEGVRDANGNMRPRDLPPRPLEPAEAARELRSFVSDREIMVFINVDPMAAPGAVELVTGIVQEALADWQIALPQLQFGVVTDRALADLVLVFKSPVPDPRDETGIRTVCSYFRTIGENQPRAAPLAMKLRALAQIAGHHGMEKNMHNRDGVKKMILAAMGYGLGLAERQDPDSVMRPGADEEKPVTKPSPDDVVLARNVWATLGLKLCEQSIATNKLDEAEKAAELIPPGAPQVEQSREALKKARAAG